MAAACLPYALLVTPPTPWQTLQLLLSLALALLVAAAALLVPWVRMAPWTHVLPPLGYLASVALLRDAGAGVGSGVGALVLLPVFWIALYGTRRQLVIVLAAVLAAFLAPVLAVGPPAYPAAGVRAGLLLAAVAGIVGVVVQDLVSRIRRQARERDALLAHVSELAHTDSLTGLPNRRAWGKELERAVARARRTGEPLTVALLDVDHFKRFNDAHGHLGGDEFAVLLPACSAADAAQVLERLLAGVPGLPTCSIGLAQWDGEATAAALVHEADGALYEAKRGGRATVVASA